MDKFLLAENPMRPDVDSVFIVHAIPPFALISAQLGQHRPPSPFCQYAFRNVDGNIEDWTLFIHYIEANESDATKLLDKAWRWYRSYMEWEDKQ